jgi:peptide chain release factor 1
MSVFINGRDQSQNKKEALKILTSRVNDMLQAKEDKEYSEFRRLQLGDGGRGSKIRTYNFLDSRVTDHRLHKKTNKIWDVMEGHLELIK